MTDEQGNVTRLDLRQKSRVPVYSPWVQALMQELSRALEALLDKEQTHCIDLSNLALTTQDRQVLQEILGTGEVKVTIGVLGNTNVTETAIAGVWWKKHFDHTGKLISELLEVALVPEIVMSQPLDVRDSLNELNSGLRP